MNANEAIDWNRVTPKQWGTLLLDWYRIQAEFIALEGALVEDGYSDHAERLTRLRIQLMTQLQQLATLTGLPTTHDEDTE